MSSESNHGRERTDESLRAERIKTDSELSRRRESVEHSADAVVSRARGAADEILQAARDTADDKQSGPPPQAVEEERTLADDALDAERVEADEHLRRERDERKRALQSLLRLEREETDQHLLIERGRSDEALGTRDIFLAMVSHDLRTLLGGIALTAELLAREPPADGSTILSRAATIQRLTARMNRLIGDLIDVASIEAGKLTMVLARGDLRAVVHESIELFQSSAASHQVQLTAGEGAEPIFAMFDHDRVLQVISNLLGNALKFSPLGTAISISVAAEGGEARVVVADRGPGIRAENLEAIFGKFRQAGRRDRRGLGLGLYISRCILEGHGGRIWAESAEGAGSTFTFALPAA
jgi:signal transduction histidine kinase